MPSRPARFSSSKSRFFQTATRLRVSPVLALVSAVSLGACGGVPEGPAAQHPETVAAPGGVPPVSDAAFASAVHDLILAAPGSPERAHLLTGVLGRQMERAATRFQSHENGRGLLAVIGGLYLLHTGELTNETLGPAARDALREAVRELALRGDEGRARALYEILLRLTPADGKADVQGHLDALSAWTLDELKAGPGTIATGSVESASVARSLLEPSEAAKVDALKATLDWIATAIDLQARFREKKARPTREEVGEAVRALHSGNEVIAEIFLRDADFNGALRALARSPSKEAIRPALMQALDAMSSKPTAAQWIAVLHALTPSPHDREDEDEEVMEDRELVRAATFGIALEAYRVDPSEPESAALVAAVLQDLGLAEASPAVVTEATAAHRDPRTVSGALTIVLRAMSIELEVNDFDAVRRTYAAAAPLLAIADQKELAQQLQPSAANVRAMMGEIELEQGSLPAARALLTASAAEEKSGGVLLALARIDRHDEQIKAALEDLRVARDAADTTADPALHGDVLLMMSDLQRESGDAPGARQTLVDALMVLVKGRTEGPAQQRARVEQVLSRVLDRFGAKVKAQQALERAFEATPHDKRQIAATLGQLVARAFVRKDLLAAHDGLTRAIAAELGDEEIVYYALWVHLLDKQLKRSNDPTPGRVFASIPDDGHWVGKLAAYGAGKLHASDLLGLARTKAEKTEATFYQVMDARTSGQSDPGDAGLRSVLRGDGVDLMEEVIARELLLRDSGEPLPPLPAGIKLP